MNCPITVDDFNRSLSIFGTAEPILKGRMTAPSPTSYSIATMTIPRELVHVHKHVKLYIDIFYVNRLVFFATKSDGGIQYTTINNIEDKHAHTIIKYLNNVIKKYASRGFIIMDIFGDGEFDVEEIISSTLPATLHICSADEHVPKIERTIRTIKERARTVCHTLPYDSFPKLLTISLMRNVAKWMNLFPNPNGISDKYSPANIIDGSPNPDFNRKRIPFGAYAMVYFGTNNTMAQRAVPAISLYESSLQGNYFLTLDTGRKINSKKWDQLPINDDVIEQVNFFATKQKQPEMPMRMPIFEWAPGLIIDIPVDDLVAVEELDPPDDQNLLIVPPQDYNVISDDDGNDDEISTDESIHDINNDDVNINDEISVNGNDDDNNGVSDLLNDVVSRDSATEDNPPSDTARSNQSTFESDDSTINSEDFHFNINNAYVNNDEA